MIAPRIVVGHCPERPHNVLNKLAGRGQCACESVRMVGAWVYLGKSASANRHPRGSRSASAFDLSSRVSRAVRSSPWAAAAVSSTRAVGAASRAHSALPPAGAVSAGGRVAVRAARRARHIPRCNIRYQAGRYPLPQPGTSTGWDSSAWPGAPHPDCRATRGEPRRASAAIASGRSPRSTRSAWQTGMR